MSLIETKRTSSVLNYNPGIFDNILDYNSGTFENYLHHWVDTTAGGRFVP